MEQAESVVGDDRVDLELVFSVNFDRSFVDVAC